MGARGGGPFFPSVSAIPARNCQGPRRAPILATHRENGKEAAVDRFAVTSVTMDSPRTAVSDLPDCWPALPLASWKDTCTTLNRWAQMVGKVRLALTPLSNHWWNVALYVSTCGLTPSPIPYGPLLFEMEFGFIEHHLHVRTSDRGSNDLSPAPQSLPEICQKV